MKQGGSRLAPRHGRPGSPCARCTTGTRRAWRGPRRTRRRGIGSTRRRTWRGCARWRRCGSWSGYRLDRRRALLDGKRRRGRRAAWGPEGSRRASIDQGLRPRRPAGGADPPRQGGRPTFTRQCSQALEDTMKYDQFFTPEQLANLRARRPTAEQRARSEAEWRAVAAGFKAALDRGEAPDAPGVLLLAARWQALKLEITAGDAGLDAGLAGHLPGRPTRRRRTWARHRPAGAPVRGRGGAGPGSTRGRGAAPN